MVYTVKQLAKAAGVSVRTLHYYDEIGLLKPTYIKENGYRYYEEKEFIKLEQILFFKELEFPLEEIVRIMSANNFDTVAALQDQRKFLELKKARIDSLLNTIDTTINTLKGGANKMNTIKNTRDDTMAQIDQYKEEAKQRWGNTEAYKQSMERTKHWTKEDYKKAAVQWKEFGKKLGDTMDKGYDSPEFQALIAKQHESINAFYDCSIDMFRALGQMYNADPRFRKTYEDIKPGLAECMEKAINYYCEHKRPL